MKTKKELNALKEEVKSVNEEMRELTEEELAQVSGGTDPLDRSGMRVTGTSKPNIEAPGYHEPGIE